METLEEGKSLLMELGHQMIVPSMLNLNPEGLQMAKVACGGQIDFYLSIYMHCYGNLIIFSSKTLS